jgi:predicted polyphosphate/ATP-dependent NAD kinase
VGIIANPASGTDIRRLVALGTVFGTQEKINIVQRILAGLHAAEVERFYIMPDAFHIGQRALERLPAHLAHLRGQVTILDMAIGHEAEDSWRAAQELQALEVGCLVVLGGDGTNRVVAKGCGEVPILAVSTGTNNVIPTMIEGTVAGLAAGFVARHSPALTKVAYRAKYLEVCIEGLDPDWALVDVAVVEGTAVGSRAVWDAASVRQVILTRAEPSSTGFSSLGGLLHPISCTNPKGLALRVGKPRVGRVTAPLAPGLLASFSVEAMEEMAIGESISVEGGAKILALDGEREIALRAGRGARVTLRDEGPWFVDVRAALAQAAAQGSFVR